MNKHLESIIKIIMSTLVDMALFGLLIYFECTSPFKMFAVIFPFMTVIHLMGLAHRDKQ